MIIQMMVFLLVMLLTLFFIIAYMVNKMHRILSCFEIEIKKLYLYIIGGIVGLIIVVTKSVFAAMILYMFLLFIAVDIIKIILKYIDKKRFIIKPLLKVYCHGLLIVVIGFIIMIYSAYNAKNLCVKEYQITIDKKMSSEINIVMFSDIHAGTSVKECQFDDMLEKVNKLNADIICLGGDIFDESSDEAIIRYACETFSNMHSVYGIYYITGNHDKAIQGKFETMLKEAGVKFIDDTATLIDNRFYLVGRADLGMRGETERTSLEKLLEQVDETYPVILLDHRPTELDEAKGTCVDLQLSGHTHAGQIFPGNIVVELFNDLGYGYEKFDSLNAVVSAGCGTWGFPIRTGSHCEIVNVILQGQK